VDQKSALDHEVTMGCADAPIIGFAMDIGGSDPPLHAVGNRRYAVYRKSLRKSIPPEAFDCCGSHPQLFRFVMEKRSTPVATRRPVKQSRP